MQHFAKENNALASVDACAAAIVETVPLVMQAMRTEIRLRQPMEVSLPQFRTLVFLERHGGASLNDVAEFLSFCPSTVSKLVDDLVHRGLLTRLARPEDRRRIMLELTHDGRSVLAEARRMTEECLAVRLAELSAEDRAVIVQCMTTMRRVFSSEGGATPAVTHTTRE